MIRRISIFGCLLLFTLFSSCKKEAVESRVTYNQKANEVLQQFILDQSCECIKEIQKESMIKINMQERPNRDVRKQLVEILHLRNRKELDSVEKLSDNFNLEPTFLKRNRIIVVPGDSLRELCKDPNFCQKGILCIKKPIFNKEYNVAVIDYGYAFMCLAFQWEVYKFENGKWKKKNYW